LDLARREAEADLELRRIGRPGNFSLLPAVFDSPSSKFKKALRVLNRRKGDFQCGI
jgi:hypothetical protein